MRRILLIFALFALLSGCVQKNLPDSAHYLTPLPKSQVQVDDVQLAYRTFGEGPPLLMIMGYAGTMDIWDAQLIRELGKEHTVIIFDNRSMGGSSNGTEKISIKRMADDSAGLLRELGYPHADVFGWSMGGLIAQEMALHYPEKVNKLVLMGTSCAAQPVEYITRKLLKMDMKEIAAMIFPPGWLEKYPDALEKLPRPARVPDPAIVQAQADAMIVWPGSCSRLSGLDKSTLVITGEDDEILPEPLSIEITELVQGSWLVRYNNATHWLMYQDPIGLGKTVNNFLAVEQDLFSN
ncbi:alpha/beta fold hydrolase [Desulfovibrio sp. JC010]|uniref:alpha/beta fold hydrolase n=1 Tax=Desulfovibrio sp. JC010 TaxID=2593641 RepID=UPI0013D263AE|nr:alpha/beta hydrolase [Desulfovibrio sp. JC010]NDV26272.1 alpha/beta hydrolase [Desulfovibrio sp. JC010]